jgi:hypothetical protein
MAITEESKILNITNQKCRLAKSLNTYLNNIANGKICKKTTNKIILFHNFLEVMSRYDTSSSENCIEEEDFCNINKFLNKLILKPCE